MRLSFLCVSVMAILGAILPLSVQADVIGKDDRSTHIPEHLQEFTRGVGLFFNGSGVCTAFCVSNNAVATAAHCLEGKHTKASDMEFVGFSDGYKYAIPVDGFEIDSRKPTAVYGNSHKATGNDAGDWALLRLKWPRCEKVLPLASAAEARAVINGKTPGTATMLSAYLEKSKKTKKYELLLKSSGNCNFQRDDASLRKIHANMIKSKYGSNVAYHSCDSVKGTSGSPIFFQTKDGAVSVVAINFGIHYLRRYQGKKTKWRSTANLAVGISPFLDKISAISQSIPIINEKDLRELQTRLKGRGFLKGNVDGKYGPQTRAAIMSFERENNLSELGIASLRVLYILRSQSL